MKLTRGEMERVIQEGGSVLHNGQVIAQIDHLPSAAELAQGDPVAEARTASELDEQIAKLQAQKGTLETSAREREKQAKAQEEAQARADADAKKDK